MARLTRRLGAAAVVAASAVGLAACGGGPNASAVAACHGVHRALVAYNRSLHAPSRAAAANDLLAAQHQVALVMQDAAQANSEDGSYNALMTLLQQAQVLPFHDVAPALHAACVAITTPNAYG